MKKQFFKRFVSFLLVLLMMLEIVPATMLHSHAADVTDKTIDFNYVSEHATAKEAIKADAQEGWSSNTITESAATNTQWVKIYDGDLKREGGKFREVMESTDPNEKYIVLAQAIVDLSYSSGSWKPIEVKSDKVLDLNGCTLKWWDATNKEKGENWQSTNITDHYKDKVFIRVKEGATLTIIDSSAPVNGYDTGKGTGSIITGGQIIDCYQQQLDYYTHRDMFEVDGNLVIYGGTFKAGRQKDMYKSNFTWEKLADCVGKTIALGVSIAEYATGLTGAEAALKDVKKEIQNSKPAEGNTSNSNDAETSTPRQDGTGGTQNKTVNTPASAGANGDASQTRPQTITERTETANSNSSTPATRAGDSGSSSSGSGSGSSSGKPNSTGQSTANTNGENTANNKGTAKVDENSKLAEAKKAVVTAALDSDKIMSMYNSTVDVIKSIGSMLGNQEGTRVTQTIFGTVARVKASGTLVVYGGTLQGHGSSANLRNATIEVTRQGLNGNFTDKGYATGGKAYIYGGTFEAFAGANVFNLIRLPKANQIGTFRNFKAEVKDHVIQRIHYYTDGEDWEGKLLPAYRTYALDDSETNGYEVVDYENQDQLKANPNLTAIPVDTSNIVVRNGTFRCHFEVNNTGARMPHIKEQDPTGEALTFIKFTGTTGSVNLGLESFGEDMIRDGRIQLNDVYGDGTLVLMDEDKEDTDSVPIKHYRLYCGDNELRLIRYLEVYPMNAGANSTNSFALQTYYGTGNLTNISSWNEENDDENEHTAPFAGDEYFFDYEFDAQGARDYYVMPRLNGGVYGAGDLTSDVWYYNLPTDTKGNVIPDITNYSIPYASYKYKNSVSYYTPVHGMKDMYIFKDGDYDDFGKATFYNETNATWRQNMKWFRYRVYRVDPITRENISESKTWGVDEPLFEVVYGANLDDVLKCKLPLGLLEDAIKAKDPSWQGYQSGELYRVVLNVDEYLNYGYTGTKATGKSQQIYYWGDYSGLQDWGAGYGRNYAKDSFAGVLPTSSTESSILIRCSSMSEQAELPNVDPSSNVFFDTNYTPLQFRTNSIPAGENATVNFVNAKVSQADNAGTDFIDVYYQWYVSDDPIIDRDPKDATKVTDTLLAGMTNICLDWDLKSDHLPHKWNPDADIYEYRNSLSPDDPNYEAYGEDGLPDSTAGWNMYNLHAYTTELRPNQLCTLDPDKVSTPEDPNELSMENNNPFAFNTDSCYIPKELAGKYLYVKAIVVNAKDEYTKIYDLKQVYYSHTIKIDGSEPLPSVDVTVPWTATVTPKAAKSNTAHATVAKTTWNIVNNGQLTAMSSTATFEANKTYRCTVELTTDSTCRIDKNTVVTINGIKATSDGNGAYFVEYTVPKNEVYYIGTDVKKACGGRTPTAAKSTETYLTVKSTTWALVNSNGTTSPLASTDTFVAGNTYQCTITLTLDSNYVFAKNLYARIGNDTATIVSRTETEVTIAGRYTATDPYMHIELPTPVAGQTTTEYDIKNAIQLDNNVPSARLYSAGWLDSSGSSFTGTFQAGQTYTAHMALQIKPSFSIIGGLKVNGVVTTYEVHPVDQWMGFVYYDFTVPSNYVNIRNVSAPVAGRTINVPEFDVDTNMNCNFTAKWLNIDGTEATGFFEASKTYKLRITFSKADNSRIMNFGCMVDGAEPTEVTFESARLICHIDQEYLVIAESESDALNNSQNVTINVTSKVSSPNTVTIELYRTNDGAPCYSQTFTGENVVYNLYGVQEGDYYVLAYKACHEEYFGEMTVGKEPVVHDVVMVEKHNWSAGTCTTLPQCSVCGQYKGAALGHTWTDATCTTPKTCSACGETEGEALGHSWREADCENPETCIRCGETTGSALGHTWVAATCAAPKTCSVCGETQGEALPHSFTEPTCTTPATCTVCGWIGEDPLGHSITTYTHTATGHSGYCSTCNQTVTEAHTFVDGTCVCGRTEQSEPTLDANIKFNHTLNLASDISANFVIPSTLVPGYDMETAYVEFTVNEYTGNAVTGTKTIKVYPVFNGYYYYFTFTGLNAVMMNDNITAVFYGVKDGVLYKSNPDVYSVVTYALAQMNNAARAESLKILCADLLRYGSTAQLYKSYRTDALADSVMTDVHRAYLSDGENVSFDSYNSTNNDITNPTVTFAGKSLLLDSKVTLRYVANLSAYTGNASDLSLVVNYTALDGTAKTVTLTNIEVYNEAAKLYCFDFDGLLAAELRQPVTVAVYKGTTRLSPTLTYSASTYGNNKTGALLTLCKHLMAYSDSAKAYFQG